MEIIAITDDSQTDEAMDLLVSHGISTAYVTPGMGIEPFGLLELAYSIASIAAAACEAAYDAENASERDRLRAIAPLGREAADRLHMMANEAREAREG